MELHGRELRDEIELKDRGIESGKTGERRQIRITRKAEVGAVGRSVRSINFVAIVRALDAAAARRVARDGLGVAGTENNP